MIFCDRCGAENPSNVLYCFSCNHMLLELTTKKASSQRTSALHINVDATRPLLHERYRKLVQVGTGGFGAVYKAADTLQQDTVVALKEINMGGLQPRQIIDATNTFNREVEILTTLKHPNLPRIHEHFTDQEHWYVIMDFIEGRTLEAYLLAHRGHLPLDEVLSIGIQLCDVLEYLHNQQPPIIFRDLKPSNIMLTHYKQVYLIDFGTARYFKPGKLKDTIALGSPGYAAPEQYGKAQTTARSDVYSLGATLHHLLTGHDPSEAPFHFASLQLLGQQVPPELETLLMQMVEIDASKRPRTVALVRQVLQDISVTHARRLYPSSLPTYSAKQVKAPIQPNLVIPPSPPSAWTRQAPSLQQAQQMLLGMPAPTVAAPKKHGFSRRNAIFIITGSIWGLSLVGKWLSHDGAPDINPGSPDQPTGPGYNQATLNYKYTNHSDVVSSIAWSRDGRNRIASGSWDKTVQVWDAQSGSDIKVYAHHTGVVNAVAWSFDSRYLASGSKDGTLCIWDIAANQTVSTYKTNSSFFNPIAWAPDGTYIASAAWQVQIWDVATGQLQPGYTHQDVVLGLAWSPNGTLLASGSQDGVIQVYDVHAQKIRQLQNLTGTISALAWSPSGNQLAIALNDGSVGSYGVQVWNIDSAQIDLTYTRHAEMIYSIAWSGQRIASGGKEETVHVWDSSTGELQSEYGGHTDAIRSISWSSDGTMVASAGDDKTVQVWTP